MINLKIAFDEESAELGSYFEECKKDLIDFINGIEFLFDIDPIQARLCNPVYIQYRIFLLNSSRFLFVAYTHGRADALTVNDHPYVEVVGCEIFRNSLFYSTACHSGKILGEEIIVKGGHAFIGYNESIQALALHVRDISIRCDNSGIKFFIQGHTIGEAYDLMKLFYKTEIHRLVRQKDLGNALILRDNLSRLVFFGDRDLTINDFKINLE